MIKISGCADTVFEEAYFVLKPSCDRDNMSERDIIAEANRIIRENSSISDKRNKRMVKVNTATFFCLVVMSSVGIVSLLLLALSLII